MEKLQISNKTESLKFETMKSFFLYLISFILVFSCSQSNKKEIKSSVGSEINKVDTIIVNIFEHRGFQFYIKKHECILEDENYFASIHLNTTDRNYFLFRINRNFQDNDLSQINDSVFIFNYADRGNCLQCTGLEVVIIKDALLKNVGRVGGYKDINKDNQKEFYVLSEEGGGRTSRPIMKVEELEVLLNGDSLEYPIPYIEL